MADGFSNWLREPVLQRLGRVMLRQVSRVHKPRIEGIDATHPMMKRPLSTYRRKTGPILFMPTSCRQSNGLDSRSWNAMRNPEGIFNIGAYEGDEEGAESTVSFYDSCPTNKSVVMQKDWENTSYQGLLSKEHPERNGLGLNGGESGGIA